MKKLMMTFNFAQDNEAFNAKVFHCTADTNTALYDSYERVEEHYEIEVYNAETNQLESVDHIDDLAEVHSYLTDSFNSTNTALSTTQTMSITLLDDNCHDMTDNYFSVRAEVDNVKTVIRFDYNEKQARIILDDKADSLANLDHLKLISLVTSRINEEFDATKHEMYADVFERTDENFFKALIVEFEI